tara:strand:- start:2562 stop:3581 length:1020 start_codon:yes stop_codon:yes gene_type:complete
MNYLVTGGSGFVGSLLCQMLLEQGHDVVNLDIIKDRKSLVKFYNINILNKKEVEKIFIENKIDIIIHSCAEVPITKSKDFYKVNLGGTKNILECFIKFKVKKLIYISSSAVFGVPNKVPVAEGDDRNPVEQYGKSKKAGEDECLRYLSLGHNITIVRPRTIIGGGRLGIFSFLFDWIQSNSNIPVLNEGNNIYQFVNLRDFCEATIISSQINYKGSLNIGSSSYDTIKNNLNKLILKANSKSKLINLDNSIFFKIAYKLQKYNLIPLHEYHFKAYGANIFFNNDQTRKILNWESKYSDYKSLEESYFNYLNSFENKEKQSPHKQSLKSILIKYAPKFLI